MAFRGDLDALVLGVLTDGQKHGYEITQIINHVGRVDAGTVTVREGQLYPILHKLENDELIEAQWREQTGKPARKVYRLTNKGQAALEEKRLAWQHFVKAVNTLIAPPSPPTLPEMPGVKTYA